MGGEDFGGSICYAKDKNLYLQAGKTAFWNVQVVGLDSVKEIKGEKIQKPQTPEAFNVIVKELQGLGLNVEVVDDPADLDKPIGLSAPTKQPGRKSTRE